MKTRSDARMDAGDNSEYRGVGGNNISIILVTHNRLGLLKECLGSIFRQRYNDYEVIVIDNHSIDGTPDYLRDMSRVHKNLFVFTSRKDLNIGAARNMGIRHAHNDILAFTDDDCIVSKEWLSSIGQFFSRNHGEHALSGIMKSARNDIAGSAGAYKLERAYKDEAYRVGGKCYTDILGTCNCAIRREVFDDIGLFKDISSGEDRDLRYRMLEKGYKVAYEKRMVVAHNYSGALFRSVRKDFLYGRNEYHMRKKWERYYPEIGNRKYSAKVLPPANIRNLPAIVKRYGVRGILVYSWLALSHLASSLGFYYEKYLRHA